METSILNFITAHLVSVLIGYVVLSTAVSAMPAPKKKSSPFYVWFYAFAHLLALNLATAAKPALEKFLPKQPSPTSNPPSDSPTQPGS